MSPVDLRGDNTPLPPALPPADSMPISLFASAAATGARARRGASWWLVALLLASNGALLGHHLARRADDRSALQRAREEAADERRARFLIEDSAIRAERERRRLDAERRADAGAE